MVRTKQESIDILLRVAIEAATRYQRGNSEKEYLLFDLELLEGYLRYIKQLNLSEKDEFVDITGNSIIMDMLTTQFDKK